MTWSALNRDGPISSTRSAAASRGAIASRTNRSSARERGFAPQWGQRPVRGGTPYGSKAATGRAQTLQVGTAVPSRADLCFGVVEERVGVIGVALVAPESNTDNLTLHKVPGTDSSAEFMPGYGCTVPG